MRTSPINVDAMQVDDINEMLDADLVAGEAERLHPSVVDYARQKRVAHLARRYGMVQDALDAERCMGKIYAKIPSHLKW